MKVLPFPVEMAKAKIVVSPNVSLQLLASMSKVSLGVLALGKIA
jgi:hypothetical protein